jgi:hypothetical protein
VKCEICNREFKNVKCLSNHLRIHKVKSKEYFDLYLKKDSDGVCDCGKSTKFRNMGFGYSKFCSPKCSTSSKVTQEKLKNTSKNKYGVEHANKVRKPKKISTDKLCSYGCEKIAQYKFKNENLCCENNTKKCPANKLSIEVIKNKYPLVFKVEKFRYNSDKDIQVRCKNHKCINSKEKNGWFIPTYIQLYERIRQLESKNGNDGCYFYCCQECKDLCPLYGQTPEILINIDKEKAGIIKLRYYTSIEYNICRDEVLKRNNNKCEYCGNKATDFHHIKPQKLEPFFSLDPDFGLACCEKCHYKYGHKDDCSTGQLAQKECQ